MALRSNELMIGDWVYAVDDNTDFIIPIKVNGINSIRSINAVIPDYNGRRVDGDIAIECCEPIPLTSEILEKNGFEEFDGWRILDMDDIEIRWIGTILEISGSHGNMELPNVKYVHELQHALRLCGTEKEIEL